jgi:cold shock protein
MSQQGHQPDDDGVDVLVDVRADERAGMASLNQGQRLSFEVVYDKRIGRSCAENLGASGLQAGARIDIDFPSILASIHRQSECRRAGAEQAALP